MKAVRDDIRRGQRIIVVKIVERAARIARHYARLTIENKPAR